MSSLPGFPKAEKVSAAILKYRYDWTDDQLKWLDDNWIKTEEKELNLPVYVKPTNCIATGHNIGCCE